MGVTTFKGGVHPYEGKELAMDQPIQALTPKGLMVFPVSQHIGAPAKPIVAKGDHVLMGQKIAEAGGFVSAPVLSSVSGTVKSIEKVLTAGGALMDAIIIENDQQYEKIEGFGQDRDYTKLSREEIVNIVKDAGIVGLGGAGFPTAVKLMPKDPSKIDYFLVNGSECEPYLTSDYRDMLESPDELIGGLKVILSLFPNAKGKICIEDNKPEAIKLLSEKVKDEPNIEVVSLLTKYPEGGERQLMFAVTGRKINSSMLPADVGVIVDNVDTVISIYKAVCKSTPLVRRILTVTGDAVVNPGNFNVPLGTNYQELVDAAGGFKDDPAKIICGGTMMGNPMFKLDVPIGKNTSSIVALLEDEVLEEPTTACIKCGRCVNVCPSNLAPTLLLNDALMRNVDAFMELNGMECISCGCCSYVCPAKRPITASIKTMKLYSKDVLRKRAAEEKKREERAAAEKAHEKTESPAEPKKEEVKKA